jgi:hypothetical protein
VQLQKVPMPLVLFDCGPAARLLGRGGQGGGAMVVQHGGYSHLEKPLLFTGQILSKRELEN